MRALSSACSPSPTQLATEQVTAGLACLYLHATVRWTSFTLPRPSRATQTVLCACIATTGVLRRCHTASQASYTTRVSKDATELLDAVEL